MQVSVHHTTTPIPDLVRSSYIWFRTLVRSNFWRLGGSERNETDVYAAYASSHLCPYRHECAEFHTNYVVHAPPFRVWPALKQAKVSSACQRFPDWFIYRFTTRRCAEFGIILVEEPLQAELLLFYTRKNPTPLGSLRSTPSGTTKQTCNLHDGRGSHPVTRNNQCPP